MTVTDANGCTAQASATITQPSAIVLSSTSTNVSCNGGNYGSINLSATAGVAPYTYSWSSSQTTANITNLTAGSYTVTVTDANGCTAQATLTITQPNALTGTLTQQTNVLCNGSSTGSLDITVVGGTASYSYLWNNGATSQAIKNLAAGA